MVEEATAWAVNQMLHLCSLAKGSWRKCLPQSVLVKPAKHWHTDPSSTSEKKQLYQAVCRLHYRFRWPLPIGLLWCVHLWAFLCSQTEGDLKQATASSARFRADNCWGPESGRVRLGWWWYSRASGLPLVFVSVEHAMLQFQFRSFGLWWMSLFSLFQTYMPRFQSNLYHLSCLSCFQMAAQS